MKRLLIFAALVFTMMRGYAQSQQQNSLGNAVLDIVADAMCCYYLEVQNEQRLPVQVILDGYVVGVVNPYKSFEWKIPRQYYGLLKIVRRDGAKKEYRVPQQAAGARVKVVV